ncbi:MAG: DUF6252 family protein [Bacteroidota bacterium]
MKKILTFIFITGLLFTSCKKKEIDNIQNQANINNDLFKPTETQANIANDGCLISFRNQNTELCIILSDVASEKFNLTTRILATDTKKAFAVLKYNDKIVYGESGEINITNNNNKLSGNYNINFTTNIVISDGIFTDIEITNQQIISFESILATDFYGNLISGDQTDWLNNKEWGLIEKSIFKQDEFSISQNDENKILGVFPNPFATISHFALNKLETTKFEFVVVNSNFEIVYESPEIYENNIAFNLSGLVTKNKYYRIYYIFTTDENEIFNGHGDIKILE